MPVTFKDNYLRPGSPKLCMPGENPGGNFRPTHGVQYPVDDVCKNMVEVIARKGWDIPGIDVTFDTHGDEESPLMQVRTISGGELGNKWRLWFCRPEFTNGRWNITTGISQINTPKQELSVFEDGSGPSLELYAGKDWAKDEDRFLTGSKVNSKLNKEPKWYLKYTGQGSNMVHDNDLGREYEPEKGVIASFKGALREDSREYTSIPKSRIFGNAKSFLEKVVAEIDAAHPDHEQGPKTRLQELSKIDIVPVPENTPTLIVTEKYSRGDNNILVAGNGWRLAGWGVRNDPENPFPERAHDGFSYGFAQEPYKSNIGLIGEDPRSSDTRIMRVQLNLANDIFVVDEKLYETTREAFSKVAEAEKRDRFTDAEVNEMTAAMARTMVSLSEYGGNYEKPIYLIGRPLKADEAHDVTEQVRQPNPDDRWNPHLNFEQVLAL